MKVTHVKKTLTDDSIVHDVRIEEGAALIEVNCDDRADAEELCRILERAGATRGEVHIKEGEFLPSPVPALDTTHTSALSEMLKVWCDRGCLPFESADELVNRSGLAPEQRRFLFAFGVVWDAMQAIEDESGRAS